MQIFLYQDEIYRISVSMQWQQIGRYVRVEQVISYTYTFMDCSILQIRCYHTLVEFIFRRQLNVAFH